jgi:hypothetical protein
MVDSWLWKRERTDLKEQKIIERISMKTMIKINQDVD